jgi:uncharacterized RDD family membrane protein YckC
MIDVDPIYAAPFKRLGSYLVDCLMVSLFFLALMGVMRRYGFKVSLYEEKIVLKDNVSTLEKTVDSTSMTKMYYIFLTIDFMYFIVFLCSKKQATIGNQLFKIMVVNKKTIRINPLVAFIRCVAVLLNAQIYYTGLLTYFFRQDRAFLQDILSETTVINLVET